MFLFSSLVFFFSCEVTSHFYKWCLARPYGGRRFGFYIYNKNHLGLDKPIYIFKNNTALAQKKERLEEATNLFRLNMIVFLLITNGTGTFHFEKILKRVHKVKNLVLLSSIRFCSSCGHMIPT